MSPSSSLAPVAAPPTFPYDDLPLSPPGPRHYVIPTDMPHFLLSMRQPSEKPFKVLGGSFIFGRDVDG